MTSWIGLGSLRPEHVSTVFQGFSQNWRCRKSWLSHEYGIINGGFHKWGYPWIIYFKRIFHEINHPAIGVPPCMETPIWICQSSGSQMNLRLHLIAYRWLQGGFFNRKPSILFSSFLFRKCHVGGENLGNIFPSSVLDDQEYPGILLAPSLPAAKTPP